MTNITKFLFHDLLPPLVGANDTSAIIMTDTNLTMDADVYPLDYGLSSNLTSNYSTTENTTEYYASPYDDPNDPDYIHPLDRSPLTDTQEMVLSLCPILPSLLSAIGSSLIIYMVLTSNRKTPYRRILLGLSCSDLLSSIILPFQGFLLPADSSNRAWAFGNDQTCTFLGWGQQMSFMSVFYNGMLSIYFLLTVRYGMKDPAVAKSYEPWMHIMSVGYPFVTATVGAGMGFYHEYLIAQGCWVYEWPEGCGCSEAKGEFIEDGAECCVSSIIGWLYGGIPTILSFLLVLINNFLVYLHVRTTIQRGRQAASKNTEAIRMSFKMDSMRNVNNNQKKKKDPQLKRIRGVATQAFWYVTVFLIVYTPSFVLKVLEAYVMWPKDEGTWYPLIVIRELTYPAQGFLNLLVYIRPNYFRARKEFPEESWVWAFRRALFGDKIKPTINDGHTHRSFRSTQFGGGSGRPSGFFSQMSSRFLNGQRPSRSNFSLGSIGLHRRPGSGIMANENNIVNHENRKVNAPLVSSSGLSGLSALSSAYGDDDDDDEPRHRDNDDDFDLDIYNDDMPAKRSMFTPIQEGSHEMSMSNMNHDASANTMIFDPERSVDALKEVEEADKDPGSDDDDDPMIDDILQQYRDGTTTDHKRRQPEPQEQSPEKMESEGSTAEKNETEEAEAFEIIGKQPLKDTLKESFNPDNMGHSLPSDDELQESSNPDHSPRQCPQLEASEECEEEDDESEKNNNSQNEDESGQNSDDADETEDQQEDEMEQDESSQQHISETVGGEQQQEQDTSDSLPRLQGYEVKQEPRQEQETNNSLPQLQLNPERGQEDHNSLLQKQLEDEKKLQDECAELAKTVLELSDRVHEQEEEIVTLKQKLEESDGMPARIKTLTKELEEQQDLQGKINEGMVRLMKVVEDKSEECNKLKGQVTTLQAELDMKASLLAQQKQNECSKSNGQGGTAFSMIKNRTQSHGLPLGTTKLL